MHLLHKILVKIPNGDGSFNTTEERDQMIDRVRNQAEAETEEFAGQAYTRRETETAGRWASDYLENVIFLSEDSEKFIGFLEESLNCQQGRIKDYLSIINTSTDSVTEIVNKAFGGYESTLSWALLYLSEILCGRYTFDSGFFDTDALSAKISKERIEEIKNSSDEWALVFFDYHN